MADTLLVIAPQGVAPYSARGLTQVLTSQLTIGSGSAQLDRTVNGELVNLTPSVFRKYATKITCTDVSTPALDGVFQGDEITVDCVSELSYLTGGSPAREVVEGSEYTEGAYTFYRPRITFLVTSFSISKDEWGAMTGWELDGDEQ